MRTLGNLLWYFPFFGFITAAGTWILGALLTLTVVAAPIGLGLMEYGKFLFWPFGNSMVSKSDLKIDHNQAWEAYSTLISIIYFPFGVIFAICGVFQAIGMAVTIIGIPPALVVVKSLGTYLNPVGKICVPGAVEDELDRRKAQLQVDRHLK